MGIKIERDYISGQDVGGSVLEENRKGWNNHWAMNKQADGENPNGLHVALRAELRLETMNLCTMKLRRPHIKFFKYLFSSKGCKALG